MHLTFHSACGKLPKSWGVSSVSEIATADPKVGLHALDQFIQAVWNTSIEKEIGGCDFNGLSILSCGREDPWKYTPWYEKLKAPVRAVNIGGLFMLEGWILPGFVEWGDATGIYDQHSFSEKCEELGICDKLFDHWKNFYSRTCVVIYVGF